MKDRRRISTTVWMAAGAALLLLYALSMGPAILALQTWEKAAPAGQLPDWAGLCVEILYFPIFLGLDFSPAWLRAPFEFYLNLWNV